MIWFGPRWGSRHDAYYGTAAQAFEVMCVCTCVHGCGCDCVCCARTFVVVANSVTGKFVTGADVLTAGVQVVAAADAAAVAVVRPYIDIPAVLGVRARGSRVGFGGLTSHGRPRMGPGNSCVSCPGLRSTREELLVVRAAVAPRGGCTFVKDCRRQRPETCAVPSSRRRSMRCDVPIGARATEPLCHVVVIGGCVGTVACA